MCIRDSTSTVQIRLMENRQPPIRMISLGRCYRKETVDATHHFAFHQMEGLFVDHNVSFADLKGTIEAMGRQLLGPKTQVRFRSHFFPFTEPSVEYDFSCSLCHGASKECRICKGTGWIEIAGAGMVDPAVFESVGYDPENYTGFAFGMGLERICRVLQGVDSNYSTDLFVPIMDKISEVTGQADSGEDASVAFRVIADHLRSLSFAVADGALPSNEGRGYVLRRMLRRATRFGRVLNMHEPFIYKLVPTLAEEMGNAFPEINKQQKHVQNVIQAEETSFGSTLDRGLEIFQKMISSSETKSSKIISGGDAFKLYAVSYTHLTLPTKRIV